MADPKARDHAGPGLASPQVAATAPAEGPVHVGRPDEVAGSERPAEKSQ